jgi:large subunit ribosomal protein L9
MNVFLLKDVTNIGTAGQVLRVKEGFARNFLLPKKLAVKATSKHEEYYKELKAKVGEDVVAQGARSALLADSIKRANIIIKRKVNEKGKLYGALGAEEIVELLKSKKISVNKKQVEISKSIKTPGEYMIAIRLTSKIKPEMKLVIKAEGEAKN